MRLLGRILLWLFFWPIMVPIALWRRGWIAKIGALVWAVVGGLVVLSFIASAPEPAPDSEQAARAVEPVPITIAPTDTLLPTDTATVEPTVAPATETPLPAVIPTETEAPLTTTPVPTAAAPNTATPIPAGNQANQNANLRAGPSTDFDLIGSVAAGDTLDIVGQNATGEWFQLASGAWIAGFLIDGDLGGLPVVAAPELPERSIVVPVELGVAEDSAGEPNPQAFECEDGCAVSPDPSCSIKGNVNSRGDRIYHMEGWRDYNRTDVKPEEGDRWFCTEQEAEDAGFRRPLRT